MKDFKLYTKFNFAKCVHLSLLSVPEGNLCSSPEGIIRIIQGFTKAFIEDFTPNQTWVIPLTEIEGYDKPLIEYTTWDEEKDGPIPGIKLFKHLNIFLEREYCEY